MIRLQGKEFQDKKPYLKMVGYQVSLNGNIRAIMKYRLGYSKKRYTHWLNESEKERFLQSNYYKAHKPLTDEELYKNKNVNMRRYKDENR